MPTTFGALKGKQKDTEYFVVNMTYGDVADKVKLPGDPAYGEQLLGDGDPELAMQRKLDEKRATGEMAAYLLNQPNSFFAAPTLFMVPRDMSELVENKDYRFVPATVPDALIIGDKTFGTLILEANCILFPGDGQHRARAIMEAIRKDYKLATVELPVILIPFKDRQQVRQLFSDLNLYAKIPNRTVGLAFETRDPVAIISKLLIEDVPLFTGRVNLKTNSLPATSRDVITMNTLYEGNTLILAAFLNSGPKEVRAKLTHLERARQGDPALRKEVDRLTAVWDVIIQSLPELDDVYADVVKVGDIREKYVFAHGLGWQAIAHAAAAIIRTEQSSWQQELERALQSVDWERTNPDWQGVAMVGTRVNNTGPGIRATAGYILEQAGIDGEHGELYARALESSRKAAAGLAAAG